MPTRAPNASRDQISMEPTALAAAEENNGETVGYIYDARPIGEQTIAAPCLRAVTERRRLPHAPHSSRSVPGRKDRSPLLS
jgi:hypothetical protein